mmetsp:Transcript_36326/g.58787  ORF Transcript_36326/g.58787 Transcript_36326/m.58787 type:complete len:84 (-) Transcript_36326:700-951(-)
MLQQQYFIELVREKGPDKIEECLDFARRELAPRAAENEQSLGEMERVMALLAFPDPANSAVGDLLRCYLPTHFMMTTMAFKLV